MRENEKRRETEGIGRMIEEESGAVSKIGGVRIEVVLEKTRKLRSGNGIVEEIFAEEEIARVESKRSIDMK